MNDLLRRRGKERPVNSPERPARQRLECGRHAALEPRAPPMPRLPHDPFGYGWYQVGYADELASGAVRPVRALGRDFVLWCGGDGQAHLMEAYCPHLGAHLGYGGRVRGNEIPARSMAGRSTLRAPAPPSPTPR